ncbi:hypothetical protein ACQ4P5_19895 [Ralstonia sp. L16]|uniref:hypothetical protein n=1 Tax=Ralstonia sp. L16 TaxID=3423950 RepID=UPI003F7B02BD
MPETKSPKPATPRKNTAALNAAKPPGSKAKSVTRPAAMPSPVAPTAAEPPYAPAICYVHPLQLGRLDRWDGVLDRIASLGFDHVLMAPPFAVGAAGNVFVTRDHAQLHAALGGGPADAALAKLAEGCRSRGLRCCSTW